MTTRDREWRFRWVTWRQYIMLLKVEKIALVLIALSAAPLAASPCASFPAGQEQWPLTCTMGGHPRALSYRPFWPQEPGKPPGRLVVEHCISCAGDPCVAIPDPAPSPDDQLCPERPAPITLATWCQEMDALPIPPGTPAGVPRPSLAVCAGAAKVAAISGDPTP